MVLATIAASMWVQSDADHDYYQSNFQEEYGLTRGFLGTISAIPAPLSGLDDLRELCSTILHGSCQISEMIAVASFVAADLTPQWSGLWPVDIRQKHDEIG